LVSSAVEEGPRMKFRWRRNFVARRSVWLIFGGSSSSGVEVVVLSRGEEVDEKVEEGGREGRREGGRDKEKWERPGAIKMTISLSCCVEDDLSELRQVLLWE
jgi:hypothetical protein